MLHLTSGELHASAGTEGYAGGGKGDIARVAGGEKGERGPEQGGSNGEIRCVRDTQWEGEGEGGRELRAFVG